MRIAGIPILAAAISIQGLAQQPAAADEAVINTPIILSSLEGAWELQTRDPEEYKQRLYFGWHACGYWSRSGNQPPAPITYYIERHGEHGVFIHGKSPKRLPFHILH